MKTLAILFTLFYFLNALAVAPYGIKGQNQSVTYPNVYQYPNYSVTGLGGINALIETGNKNILENPSFEAPFFGSAPPSWTSLGMTFNTSALPLSGQKAVRVSMSSSAMAFAQDSGVSQAAFAGGIQCLAMVYVKTTVSGIFVSSRQNSVTSTTNRVAVNNDGKYGLYKVPFICGSGSNGISIHSNGVTVTGDVDIDDAFVGVTDIAQIYSAIGPWTNYTPTGSWTSGATYTGRYRQVGENLEVEVKVLGTSTVTAAPLSVNIPPQFTADYSKFYGTTRMGAAYLEDTGVTSFHATVFMNPNSNSIRPLVIPTGGTYANITDITNVLPFTFNTGDVVVLTATFPVTQFSGSVSTYSSTNADYGARAYTPTLTAAIGSISNYTISATHRRKGKYLKVDGKILFNGTPSSFTQPRISMPSGISIDTTLLPIGRINDSATTLYDVGVSEYTGGGVYVIDPNTIAVFSSSKAALANPIVVENITQASPFGIASGDSITFSFEVPILGWEDSNIIIGQFNGLQTCVDTKSCTDTFSVTVSAAGVVSGENVDWITGNCTNISTGQYLCPFNTGIFTATPNCVASHSATFTYQQTLYTAGASSSAVSVVSGNNAGAANIAFTLVCQKQGADYIGKTAMAVASDQNLRTPGITKGVEYRARINFASSIIKQEGSWISSVTNNSTGNATINIPVGTFSEYPYCQCVPETSEGDTGFYTCNQVLDTLSTTAVKFRGKNNANTLFNINAVISCKGTSP